MKIPLYKDPLTIRETTRLCTERLARRYGWGVLFIAAISTVLGLVGGYVAAGGMGLLITAFIGIVASSSSVQAEAILAALTD